MIAYKIFIFTIINFSLMMQFSHGMEKEYLLEDNNAFNMGLYDTIQDIDTPLLNNLVSQETKKLINRFYRLPQELQEHIISYLDNHSLAFFIHLLPKKEQEFSQKRLDYIYAHYLINKLNNSDFTENDVLQKALAFTKRKNYDLSHSLFYNINSLQSDEYSSPKNNLFPDLMRLLVKNTYEGAVNCPNDYTLRIALLTTLKESLKSRIQKYDAYSDCYLMSRYCLSTTPFCISGGVAYGCAALNTTATTALIYSTFALLGCVGSMACCITLCLCNNCYDMPEKKYIHKGCCDFWCPRKGHAVNLSSYTTLPKALSLVNSAITRLQAKSNN